MVFFLRKYLITFIRSITLKKLSKYWIVSFRCRFYRTCRHRSRLFLLRDWNLEFDSRAWWRHGFQLPTRMFDNVMQFQLKEVFFRFFLNFDYDLCSPAFYRDRWPMKFPILFKKILFFINNFYKNENICMFIQFISDALVYACCT